MHNTQGASFGTVLLRLQGLITRTFRRNDNRSALLSLPVMTGNHTRRGGGGRGGVKRKRRRKKKISQGSRAILSEARAWGRERGVGRWTGSATALDPDTCSSRFFYFLIIFFFKFFSFFVPLSFSYGLRKWLKEKSESATKKSLPRSTVLNSDRH